MNISAPTQTSPLVPWRGTGTLRAFAAGAAANSVVGLLSLVLAPLLRVPSPPQLIQERLTELLPLTVTSGVIGLLGAAAKPVVLALIGLGWLAAGGAAGVVAGRHHRPGWTYPLLLGAGLWLAAVAVLLPALGEGLLGTSAPSGPVRTSFLWLVLAAAYLLLLEAMTASLPAPRQAPQGPADQARRHLMGRLALGVVGATAALALGRWLWAVTRLPQESASSAGQLSPEVTPTEDFYTVSKNFVDPRVSEAAWSLRVTGLVERPLTLSYQEMLALGSTRQYLTLVCISNEVGGPLMGNALWEGVPLADLLGRAGVRPGARKVVLTGEDDYSDSFPVDKALEPGTLLAHRMNGEPLTPPHGFPLRALVPGIYGMKNVKWLREIEVVDYDFQGFWQERGWSDQAIIKTTSRLDLPTGGDYRADEVTTIDGVAFAGGRGISRVEVSTDAGRTWKPAQVRPALSPYTWALWLQQWSPAPGRYEVLVRAADGLGQLQPAEEREPLPDGASGYHRIVVRVQPR